MVILASGGKCCELNGVCVTGKSADSRGWAARFAMAMIRAMNSPLLLRNPCPPGACDCQRDELLDRPGADTRVLLLTRQEEQRLLERLENLQSLEDLERMQQRMFEQLGIRLHIEPAHGEVRSMRGIHMHFDTHPGLCRKTQQSIPAAIRRAMEKRPEIAWRLLDSFDLFGGL